MRILILTSSTGGGHDMRAGALQAWVKQTHGQLGITTQRLQTLEETHGLYQFGVGIYNAIQKIWPRAHHAYFNYLEVAGMHATRGRILGADAFKAAVKKAQPNVVLSTHAHLNHGYFALAREAMANTGPIKCVTYCGELHGRYGFSKHWVSPQEADLFIGAVPSTLAAAQARGMPKEKCLLGGFLLKPIFYTQPENEAAKQAERAATLESFDLPAKTVRGESAFTLLLATGANGANQHLKLIQALHKAGVSANVLALCGHNKNAQLAIAQWAAAHMGSNHTTTLNVRALGYRKDMPQLMRASNLIFARPGTGTTSEAMLQGCPILFNGLGGVMPQERITVDFANTNGFGTLAKNTHAFTRHIHTFIKNPQRLQNIQSAMRAACPNVPSGNPLHILHALKALAE